MALIVVDMPFGSYEESLQIAFRNAAWVTKENGCGAVKLEGSACMADTIGFLTQRGIPVMARIGLTPQSSHTMGDLRPKAAIPIAGPGMKLMLGRSVRLVPLFFVFEGMIEGLADQITQNIEAPTIGIGASLACCGQILVLEDMLGRNT